MDYENRHLVLWDGVCGMCARFARSIERADLHQRLQLVPYQQCPTPPMTPELREACEDALHVITTEGEVLRGADAVFFVYQQVGWKLAGLLRARPILWLAEPPYRLIAANRRWSSKFLYTGDEGLNAACAIDPDPSEP